MNNTGNHNKPWSDTDIRKYLKGELSAREMHDLERAALDDPFLADALEGLPAAFPLETDLEELQARLAARVEEKKQRPPVLWFRRPAFRVAAAVILLTGIGMTAYYSFFQSKSMLNVDVVRNEPAPVAVPVAPTSPAQQPAAPTAPASRAQQPAAPADTPPALATRKAGTARKTDTKVTQDPAADKDVANSAVAANSPPAERADYALHPRSKTADSIVYTADSIVANAGLARNKDERELAKSSTSLGNVYAEQKTTALRRNAQPLSFSGRVVDANNHPLAGASLFLNNTPKIGTTTDNYGYFNFKLRPRDTAQQLTVALIGFKQTQVSLNANALENNIIQLQEAKPSLNEVVVTGYGAKRKETYATAPSDDGERLDSAWIKVYPVIGKLAYQQYLDTAKRALKLDSTIYGNERVSFQVDQKGQITEFKIEQSLSPAHDAGVINLISSGPAWKLLRGKKARAIVSITFP